ncbi:MAG: serine/threonine-protein phosphatase [Chloroflexi bacterium]|nr:serine/threonine-protein phosphatase [Chloroflexota bacterium]
MPDIILGSNTYVGGRPYNEDRCRVQKITTRRGLKLEVAVVADGLGGEQYGERAAQLAVDAFIDYVRQTAITDTLQLLISAVQEANSAVFNETSRLGGAQRMAATFVAAIIEKGQTLYVANAGDSRMYLCRNGKLVQLTRDHNFANTMVWMGRLTPQAAAVHPNANKVTRVVGIKENIEVDVGIYTATTDYDEANRIGRDGLKLTTGDTILLCSDGLIKKTPKSGQTLVTDEEIVQVLQTQEGEEAARAIMSIALGRIPVSELVDNITLALLQTADPSRATIRSRYPRGQETGQRRDERRKMALIAAAVGIPLGLALLVTAFFGFSASVNANAAGTATGLAEAAVALAQTQTAIANTSLAPTGAPLPTAMPAAVSGEIAQVFNGDLPLGVITDDDRSLIAVPENETRYVAVTYLRYNSADPPVEEDGNIFLQGKTQLHFEAVTSSRIQFTLVEGSDIFIQTGPYLKGAEIQLADSSIVVVSRGCLSLHYIDAKNIAVGCFDGECGYSAQLGSPAMPFDKGTRITIVTGPPMALVTAPIAPGEYAQYRSLLAQSEAGRKTIDQCRVPNVAVTQPAQPTPRPVQPTAQAVTPATAQAAATAAAPVADTAVVADATATCDPSSGTPCP